MQSLSEESSGSSTRRRRGHALSPSSPSGASSAGSLGEVDPFGEGEAREGEVGEAANPYVKIPVPKPRTSLLRVTKKLEDRREDDDGCESDSTLDPRAGGRRGREERWEETEVEEEDQLSILTDGVAEQMMY